MSNTLPVFAALPSLGFVPGSLGLKFVHAPCKLRAVENPLIGVSFAGHYNHGRSMGSIEFNLPPMVESLDQLKALLAYNLRDAFIEDAPEWVVEGRALSTLLPWECNRAAYAGRDRCMVRREWLKLALKDLADALRDVPTSGCVTFGFDGMALSIDCGRRIVVQAEGSAWREQYQVRADQFTWLTKRLMRDRIEISVWQGHLLIGDRRHSLASQEVG